MLRYENFDLEIRTHSNGYRVRVIGSPAGEAEEPFTFPFTNDQLENFVLKLGVRRGNLRRRETRTEALTREWGSLLFKALFTGDIGLRFHASQASICAQENVGLRIRLRLSDVPALMDVPWEYLFDTSRGDFVTASRFTPLIRYLDVPSAARPMKVKPPLRVLVLVALPSDLAPLDADGEFRALTEALQARTGDGSLTLERLQWGSKDQERERGLLEKLHDRLLDSTKPVHVLHYIGHGGYTQQTDDGFLCLEGANGRSHEVSGRDLARVVTDHRSLRLLVLNACEGARSSLTDPFAGVAQSLIRSNLPAVVAMQFEISDRAAIRIAEKLYSALCLGLPLESAISASRMALLATGNDVEWATPVLYLRGTDGQLFDVPGAAAAANEFTKDLMARPEVPVAVPDEEPATVAAPEESAPQVAGEVIHWTLTSRSLGFASAVALTVWLWAQLGPLQDVWLQASALGLIVLGSLGSLHAMLTRQYGRLHRLTVFAAFLGAGALGAVSLLEVLNLEQTYFVAVTAMALLLRPTTDTITARDQQRAIGVRTRGLVAVFLLLAISFTVTPGEMRESHETVATIGVITSALLTMGVLLALSLRPPRAWHLIAAPAFPVFAFAVLIALAPKDAAAPAVIEALYMASAATSAAFAQSAANVLADPAPSASWLRWVVRHCLTVQLMIALALMLASGFA